MREKKPVNTFSMMRMKKPNTPNVRTLLLGMIVLWLGLSACQAPIMDCPNGETIHSTQPSMGQCSAKSRGAYIGWNANVPNFFPSTTGGTLTVNLSMGKDIANFQVILMGPINSYFSMGSNPFVGSTGYSFSLMVSVPMGAPFGQYALWVKGYDINGFEVVSDSRANAVTVY